MLPIQDSAAAARQPFCIAFDSVGVAPGRDAFRVGLPVIAGDPGETLFSEVEPSGRAGAYDLFTHGDWLLGRASVAVSGDLEIASRRMYESLIAAASRRHLCRVWNYVPAINGHTAEGLESYQVFSLGRSLAFEAAFGRGFEAQLPAASAVGCRDGRLSIVFAATTAKTIHLENPAQVPAYQYPPEYGPRAPSFARATVVGRPGGRHDLFLAGTSAIRGHATVSPGDTAGQLSCTLENLRRISVVSGLDDDLGNRAGGERFIKIYLRQRSDLALVEAILRREMIRPGDRVSYLEADICRAELNIEIEVSIFGVSGLTLPPKAAF